MRQNNEKSIEKKDINTMYHLDILHIVTSWKEKRKVKNKILQLTSVLDYHRFVGLSGILNYIYKCDEDNVPSSGTKNIQWDHNMAKIADHIIRA